MFVDNDDVSHNYFFRIPPDWCQLTKTSLGGDVGASLIMSNWIETCISDHPECATERTTPFNPTRLLDLTLWQECNTIKLIVLDDQAPAVQYVALSHCWGPPSQGPIRTTKNTLARHKAGISFWKLSLTFQDAVKLTYDLGQRYLWIDSLCIIQDDAEDWEHEASRMSQVYGNSIFTLSALSSADGTHGCRVVNTLAPQDHRYFDLTAGNCWVRIFERDIVEWGEEYGDDIYRRNEHGKNPLRGRAWTLQERELSVRNIHFSHNLILWECKRSKNTSELPWDNVEPFDDFPPQPLENFPGERLLSNEALTSREQWYGIMEDYMSRALTNSKDKLPALAGLARRFKSKMSSSSYLAGLWSIHLPYNLLWRVDSTAQQPVATRPTCFRAPSWSFLSLDGAINYGSQRLTPYGALVGGFLSCGPHCIQVLGYDVRPAGMDPYGAVTTASLSLHGAIVPLQLVCHVSKEEVDSQTAKETWTSLVGEIYLDMAHDVSQHAMTVWCIAVRPESYWSFIRGPEAIYRQQILG
ncbi:HET-domain-containing protein [Phaeosphaeriaceae sp. SRC1lsM3a]|nr:HET-domain-containing protein [Stagonospora sp. SRC1lsM3a]